MRAFMLTQADEGPKALNFWLKQKLSEGEAAQKVLSQIHAADPKKNVWYENATPMLCEVNLFTGFVLPAPSPRAQKDIVFPASIPDKTNQDNAPRTPEVKTSAKQALPGRGGRTRAAAKNDGPGAVRSNQRPARTRRKSIKMLD
eukprot:SAG31_NODE_3836_length_3834_cov_8.054886_3_plen_144_part_00